jgi:DNA polymerase-3 subunit epsilon
MLRRWRHHRRCQKLGNNCAQPVLSQYLEACGALNIDHIENTPMISVDLELTGLDQGSDRIIAIGWTLIDHGRIRIGSNHHLLINAGQTVGSSATIHELLDSEVEQGEDLETALEALFSAAKGRVWVLHHAGLDVGFLKQACEHWADTIPGFIVLDTLRIEQRLRERREQPVKQGDLQLGQIRSVYGLPAYTAHDALGDAFATAELLLAIAAQMDRKTPLRLAPHLNYF